MKSVLFVFVAVCLAAAALAEDDRVKIVVMTESLCPDCVKFAHEELKKLMDAPGVFERTAIEFLAWGNAYTETTSPELCPSPTPGKYNATIRQCWASRCVRHAKPELFAECFNTSFEEHITCQHGPDEDIGNRIESCALHLSRNPADGYMTFAGAQFVHCYLGVNSGNKSATYKCAANAGIDYNKITNCANSFMGYNLVREEAIRTNDFGPHPGVPYVLINGVPLDDDKSFLHVVCSQIKGQKPSGCKFPEWNSVVNKGMCV